MKKNFKIVSSLALAGLLATNAMGVVSAATANDQITTEPVGVYKKLVEGKTIVPFVLTNRDDVLTIKDIKESKEFNITKFNGLSISDENTVVGTGDTFTSNGQEYTVVVYGDVDGNGKINSTDALQLEKHITGIEKLDAVQQEAADIVNNAKLNSTDSLTIKKYVVGLTDEIIDVLPEKEEEVINSNYEIQVNENGMINRQTAANTKLKIKVAKTLDKAATYAVYAKTADGEAVQVGTVTVRAHTDYLETNVNLSGLEDGKVTITFVEDKTVVAKVEAEKNIVEPVATNVTTKRTSTKQATLSLEKCGESDIVKVHYLVQPIDEATKTDVADLKETINVSNNKVENATVATELETAKAYKVTYALENSYGSVSDIKTVVITSDAADIKVEEKVEKITNPDLSKTDSAEFTWDAESGKTYAVTLYKDGEPVKAVEVTEGSVDFTADMDKVGTYQIAVFVKGDDKGLETSSSEITKSDEVKVTSLAALTNLKVENQKDNKVKISWDNSNKKEDFGTYQIDLYTVNEKGEEIKNTTITAPENDKNEVTFTISPNTMYLVKAKVVAKDGQIAVLDSEEAQTQEFYQVSAPVISANTDIGTNYVTLEVAPIQINNKKVSYSVKVYDVKTDNDQTEARYTLKTTQNVEVKDGKMTITGLEQNKTYAFKVVAKVDANEVESDYSEEVKTLMEIKDLTVATPEEASKENSGKVAVDRTNIIINGKTLSRGNYSGVTSDKTDNDQTEARYTLKTTQNVEVKDGKMTITGLEQNKTYAFKVVAKVDANEVESDYSEEVKTLMEIKDLTVATPEEASKENSGKVAVDRTNIIINGKTLSRGNYSGVTSDKIDKEYKIIEALENGDKVTINEDASAITVELDGGASAEVALRDFSAIDLSKTTISIESNNFSKTIKGNFKGIELAGTESIFTLTDAKAEKITLNNGVEVNGDKVYTVKANATVTINNIKVGTQKEITIDAMGAKLNLDAGKEANNLIFENKTENAVITFNGLGDNTSEQTGTITMKSNGGKITVKSDKVNISSKLDIQVNNGDIDISEESITGEKNISIAKDANTTINAIAKTKAPVTLTNIEAKDYTDEEIVSKFGEDVVVEEVRAYINSFGVNGKGAKITVAKDSTEVTITFEKATESTNISNLK